MLIKYKLSEIVKDNTVSFSHYRDGDLWYNINQPDGTVLCFPVPISDAGTATFLAKDKAILFMRYIRKYIAVLEKGADGKFLQ